MPSSEDMMGRGSEGGSGSDEKPCPLSRPPSSPRRRSSPEAGDLFDQARKALSYRSPYDDEEAASRSTTLPARLAAFLSKHPDGRKKHKKSHGDPSRKKSSGQGRPPTALTVWDHTEEYFRQLTLSDIDILASKSLFGSGQLDSCLTIPILGKNEDALDVGAVEVSSSSAPIISEQPEKAVPLDEEQVGKAEAVEVRAMEIDEPGPCGDSLMEREDEESSSMNWVLGSKHRFLLTSERPNKKHKLLAGDAGLGQLLRLPHLKAGASELLCDVCCLGPTGMESNRFVCCDSCKVSVHQRCYGIHNVPIGAWLCSWCNHLKDGVGPCSRHCLLCPKEGGAMKPVSTDTDGRSSNDDTMKFVHLFCSLWTPEVYVENTRTMEPVLNIGGVQETRRKLVCYLCKVKYGVCIRCSHGTCRTSFHPLCARESKHQMEIWGKVDCDNVELRAFCSKHSSPQVTDRSSLANPSSVILPTNKLPILRFNLGNRDKSMMQDEIPSSEKLVKNENTPEQDTLAARLNLEVGGGAELMKSTDTEVVTGGRNNVSNTSDIVLVLRKLVDRGKINVDDVASEMGISSNSLKAALLGSTTSLSPELKLKIIKWLQDSAHILKVSSGSGGVARVDSMNAAKVITGPFVPGDVKVSELDTPDAAVIKSLPSRRRAKNNIRILKDNRTPNPSAATLIQKNCNGKLVDEKCEIPVVLTEDMKEEVNDKKSSHHDQDCYFQGLDHSETMFEGTAKPIDSSPSLDPPPRHIGNPDYTESNDLSDTHRTAHVKEQLSSFESGVDHADEAEITVPDTLEKGFQGNACDVDVVASGAKPDLVVSEPYSSYVHKFIQRRLLQVQNYAVSEQKYGNADSNGHNEKTMISVEVDTSVSANCNKQPLHSPCTDINHASDEAKLDQLAKAKKMGVVDLSPDDEVEGEMLYLQTKLLDRTVAIKHICDDIIFKVVQNLPEELDALNKRGWNQTLVSQFLYDVREAKKRGRKERRHKEAQAVLAAAAAAAAASSRNSSLRKDANDEIISSHQESPLKATSASGRVIVTSPLVPRAKESSRSAMLKGSPDKHSGTFQMADFSQENALSCDICRRAETMLNRIFVCSMCKVAVHLDCYRKLNIPIGPWKCELCEEITSRSRSPRNETVDGRNCVDAHCGLCGGSTGAFRKSTDGQWIHAFCAEWLLEPRYRRGQQNPVEGMDTILKEKNLRSCCTCHRSVGVCLKCSYGHCQITFHPSCARNAGLYMNVKVNGGRLQHKAYCEKHSFEQREADSQQHGAEELKSIHQIRVELEKVRLLCERIIRREKLKRDLVVCSHDILASRRDHVAFSRLVRSSFFPPGVSSESATTSINNRSYSGTMQRSDDITVDSTISGKPTVRPSMRTDTERKNDDSSTSQLSYKRKFPNRASFAGKQLPHRQASKVLRNSAELGEQRSKARKHTETFQKELVMTSDQASMQNQRLPKGFAYVPIGSLSKEKPTTSDLESHEPQEPGG